MPLLVKARALKDAISMAPGPRGSRLVKKETPIIDLDIFLEGNGVIFASKLVVFLLLIPSLAHLHRGYSQLFLVTIAIQEQPKRPRLNEQLKPKGLEKMVRQHRKRMFQLGHGRLWLYMIQILAPSMR